MTEIKFKWVPVIDEGLCNGCQECVCACSLRCLEVVDCIAVLTKPDICGSEEHCVAPCPVEAVHMEWKEMAGDEGIGKWYKEKHD